jgi:hypothetical protein
MGTVNLQGEGRASKIELKALNNDVKTIRNQDISMMANF